MTAAARVLDHAFALEAATGIQAALRMARIYEPNNTLFQELIDHLLAQLTEAFECEGAAGLRIKHGALFFNRISLKFDFINYFVFKNLAAEFDSLGLGAIEFQGGLTRDELVRGLTALAEKRGPAESAFEHVSQAFQRAGVTHIHLERESPDLRPEQAEKDSAKIYFLGIHLLKHLFEQQQASATLNLNVTRRWMQSVFGRILDDEYFTYGLTNIKNYDEYTLNHSLNVCVLSLSLGRRLGLNRSELIELGIAGFLHDLGKLKVDKDILNKPDSLNDDEREEMENHVRYGAEMLLSLRKIRHIPVRAIQVAFEHHLNIDLSGYPRFVRKRTLPLFSRIVKIVDYYDALTTRRVYRPNAFTKEDALTLMVAASGREFDAVLLKAFVAMIGAYPIGSFVALNTGELGIVFESNAQDAFIFRPKVKLITDAQGNRMDGALIDLAEVDPETRCFKRTIVKSLDPDKYGLKVSDFFLARAN